MNWTRRNNKTKNSPGRRSFLGAWIVLAFLSAAIVSCSGTGDNSGSPESTKDDSGPIVKSFTRGGAPLRVDVSVSSDSITIADRLEYKLSVVSGPGCRATLPSIADLDVGDFLIKDHRLEGPSAAGADSTVESIVLILEPQLSGEYTIGPAKVTFTVDKDTISTNRGASPDSTSLNEINSPLKPIHEIRTDPLTIKVGSLIEKNTSSLIIEDIRGPVEYPRDFTYWYIGAVAVLLLGLGVFAFFMVVNKRKRKHSEVEIRVSPYEKAIERLRRLRESRLLERGEYEAFVVELSRIVRIYIGDRFGIKAPEKTTEEFLDSIVHDNNFSDSQKELLKDFLTSCDLVKFAKYTPETEELQASLDLTLRFLNETKPKESTETSVPENGKGQGEGWNS